MNACSKTNLALAAATALMLLGGSAQAHHSKAMFDSEKCATIAGTVRTFEWVYPHAWLWIVVNEGTGNDGIWGFESMSPAQLYGVDHRWTRESVKKGDKVSIRYSPMKDGRHGGSMNSVTVPNGLVMLGSPDACAGAAGNPKSPGDPDSPLRQ